MPVSVSSGGFNSWEDEEGIWDETSEWAGEEAEVEVEKGARSGRGA